MVRRCRTLEEVVSHIYANTKPEGGCLVTTKSTRHGYGAQAFNKKMDYAHRLVARYYLGPCPKGQEVRHLCGRGNKGCVTSSHLRYGTREQNCQDRVKHGTSNRGERHGMSKLTEKEVRLIRDEHAAGGVTYTAIGLRFGVARRTISDIVKRNLWSWLD